MLYVLRMHENSYLPREKITVTVSRIYSFTWRRGKTAKQNKGKITTAGIWPSSDSQMFNDKVQNMLREKWTLVWWIPCHFLLFLSYIKNYIGIIQPNSQAQEKLFNSSRPSTGDNYTAVYAKSICGMKATSIHVFSKTVLSGLTSTWN